MRLVSCLNPQHIVNPYTHERLTVACGKCDACRNRHASFWVKKLRAEQRSWKYCIFVTLSYDNEHLPTLHFDEVNDEAVDYSTGFRIPLHELITKDKKSNRYLFARLRTNLGLPYCSTDVIQKFHKRLNKYIHDNFTQTYQNFRYFLATEYGGTTYRTHHHALYFFNNDRVAASFQEILVKTWQNSYLSDVGVKSEQVTGNAASYVAQYINCSSHYPAFYQNPKVRPKYYFSKSPSLGSLEPLDESLRQLFFRCSPTRFEYNAARNTYDNVRIPFQVENRLYPRIARFREVSDSARARLLEFSRGSDSFPQFKEKLCRYKKDFDAASEYFPQLGETDKEFFSYINWLTNSFKFNKSDYADLSGYKLVLNRTLRFYYISRRVCVQSSQFDIPVSRYSQLITRYYENLNSFHLKNFYDVQEKYSFSHSSDDIGLLYTDTLSYNLRYQREVVPILENSFAWQDLRATSKMIMEKNTKTHRKNEYFDSMKDKHLRNIINSYLNG